MTSLELTQEERYDNAAWRMRLEVDQVFSKNYTPKEWERKEMDAIINFLGLKDPELHSDYLVRDICLLLGCCFYCSIGVYFWMYAFVFGIWVLSYVYYLHSHIICSHHMHTPLIYTTG